MSSKFLTPSTLHHLLAETRVRPMTNKLYYGDNLQVLRDSIADESVDLIYLDPPFNSNASYNVLFRGAEGSRKPSAD